MRQHAANGENGLQGQEMTPVPFNHLSQETRLFWCHAQNWRINAKDNDRRELRPGEAKTPIRANAGTATRWSLLTPTPFFRIWQKKSRRRLAKMPRTGQAPRPFAFDRGAAELLLLHIFDMPFRVRHQGIVVFRRRGAVAVEGFEQFDPAGCHLLLLLDHVVNKFLVDALVQALAY